MQIPSGRGRHRIREALGQLSKNLLIRLYECAIIGMYVQSCLSLEFELTTNVLETHVTTLYLAVATRLYVQPMVWMRT